MASKPSLTMPTRKARGLIERWNILVLFGRTSGVSPRHETFGGSSKCDAVRRSEHHAAREHIIAPHLPLHHPHHHACRDRPVD